MSSPLRDSRRQFLTQCATASACVGGVAILPGLPSVRCEDAALRPEHVQFTPEIEPLVRFLEDTPRDRLIEEAGRKVRDGLAYRELLTALMLAGVRNIQPRPVGFKFHAVLVVNSAHMASLASPEEDKWLPIFWALDQFKSSQERDVNEGNWTMSRLDESKVPSSAEDAKRLFQEGMDAWDEEKADVAAAGLARHAPQEQAFDLFCRYGARDFRDIGHKIIYVSNAWRTLENIGWRHAEGVLRSLAYALLAHGNINPVAGNAKEDVVGRLNWERVPSLPDDWAQGGFDEQARLDLLSNLHVGTDVQIAKCLQRLFTDKSEPGGIWETLNLFAAEMLMRMPGIVSLHASTMLNASRFAFEKTTNDLTRRFLLLQAAAFLANFRDRANAFFGVDIYNLEASSIRGDAADSLEEIYSLVGRDNQAASSLVLGYLRAGGDAKSLVDGLQRLIYLKGTDSHDYKFSVAVFEDCAKLSPEAAQLKLASAPFWLKGASSPDSPLVEKTRAALA